MIETKPKVFTADFFRKAGRKGGKKTVKKYGTKHMSIAGRKGGLAGKKLSTSNPLA